MRKVVLALFALAAVSVGAVEYQLNVVSNTTPKVYLMPSVAGNSVSGAYWQLTDTPTEPKITSVYQPELALPTPIPFEISAPAESSVFDELFLHFFETNFRIYDR